MKNNIFIKKSIVALAMLCGTQSIANYAIVDLSQQKLSIYDGDTLLFLEPISSGNRLHPTPQGTFRVLKKERYHKSNLYPIRGSKRGGAEMNYMLKITHGGVAIHEGNVVFEGDESIPVSHGCIRLSPLDAQRAYTLLKEGDKIIVRGVASYQNGFNEKLHNNDMLYDMEVPQSTLNITFLEE